MNPGNMVASCLFSAGDTPDFQKHWLVVLFCFERHRRVPFRILLRKLQSIVNTTFYCRRESKMSFSDARKQCVTLVASGLPTWPNMCSVRPQTGIAVARMQKSVDQNILFPIAGNNLLKTILLQELFEYQAVRNASSLQIFGLPVPASRLPK
jgi:hypothetical protein